MIPVLLRDMAPRLVLVALVAFFFYLLEPGFHQHEGPMDPSLVAELGPVGIGATLANLAGLAVLILLGGFISGDRRNGYYRMYFSHPVSPLSFYGLRWALGVLLALLAAAVFLVVGQVAAWGGFRGGWIGLFLALLSAITYGGVLAFLSATLRKGDAWVAILLFVFTYFWLWVLGLGAEPFTPGVRQGITFLLPPQTALQDVYTGLVAGMVDWGAAAYAAGYGLFWLVAAGVMLRVREWP